MTRRALTLEEKLLGAVPANPGSPVDQRWRFRVSRRCVLHDLGYSYQDQRHHVQGPVQNKTVALPGKHSLRVAK